MIWSLISEKQHLKFFIDSTKMTQNSENILAKVWNFNAGYWFEKLVDNALISMIYGIFH